MLKIQDKKEGVSFKIRVQPRSSTDRVAGLYDDALKINLKAPPVDNAANKACIKFLSKTLSIPKSSISITAGHTSRNKRIFIRCDTGPEKGKPLIKKKIVYLAQL